MKANSSSSLVDDDNPGVHPSTPVKLDPASLLLLSKFIEERITKELDDRENKILDEVRSLLIHQDRFDKIPDARAVREIQQPETQTQSVKSASMIPKPTLPPINTNKKEANDTNITDAEYATVMIAPKKVLNHSPKSSKLPVLKNKKPPSSAKKGKRGDEKAVGDAIHYPHCRSAVYAPTNFQNSIEPVTQSGLQLTHVHGYDGDYGRHGGSVKGKNVVINKNGHLIYPAAALVVLMDHTLQGIEQQGFFTAHTEDVISLTLHPNQCIVASGQMGRECNVMVWDSTEVAFGQSVSSPLATLKTLPAVRGVSGLSFTGDGRFLGVLSIDESHTLLVYDWRNQTMIAHAKVGHLDVSNMVFNKISYDTYSNSQGVAKGVVSKNPSTSSIQASDDSIESSCYTLISYGGKNIKFWTLRQVSDNDANSFVNQVSSFKGRRLVNKKEGHAYKYKLEGNLGSVQQRGTPVEYTCLSFIDDVGEVSGVVIDGEQAVEKVFPTSRIFAGTKSGSIMIWQQLLDEGEDKHCVWLPRGKLLSVVTEAHESPLADMDYIRLQTKERLVSSSTDGVINIWGIQRSQGKALPLEHLDCSELAPTEFPRSLCWSSDGSAVVAGCIDNSIHMLKVNEKTTRGVGGEVISVVMFPVHRSHNGKVRRVTVNPLLPSLFASISSDGTIRLWDTIASKQLSATKLPEQATAVDFSPDGFFVAVGTESGEILVLSNEYLNKIFSDDGDVDLEDISTRNHVWKIMLKRKVGKNGE